MRSTAVRELSTITEGSSGRLVRRASCLVVSRLFDDYSQAPNEPKWADLEMSVTVSVLIPVYNMDAELRRALRSIQEQTFEDFECIVIDDASTIPIQPIVKSLGDKRFAYTRNTRNGGPHNARVRGYQRMRGDVQVGLDSDCEAYPWMLGQAVKYLQEMPEIDGVAGINIRANDGSPFVRIRNGRKLVGPTEYVNLPQIPDCAAAVRRSVVDEWLQKRDDYFAFEGQLWFTFHMHHSLLFVDEPWVKVHVGGADRVSGRRDDRQLDDYVKFLDEHLTYVDNARSVVLDGFLEDGWFQLRRAGRQKDAARFAHHMAKRGLSKRRVIARRAARKAQQLLPVAPTRIHYLD
jgi:glycosyltransferase involved in cell wall biosynthesis